MIQETLRYDDASGTTSSMRGKEDANDYRYFRDPDLVTILTSREEVEEIRSILPELPAVKQSRYTDDYGIPEKDAQLLTKYRKVSEYFDEAIKGLDNPKTAANFIIGSIFRRVETEKDKETFDVPVSPAQLNELVKLIEDKKIQNNLAKKTLEKMLDTGKSCTEFIDESDLGGVDDGALEEMCRKAIESNPNAVSDYRGGKEKALMSLLGNVMKQSRGKADAVAVKTKLIELIAE